MKYYNTSNLRNYTRFTSFVVDRVVFVIYITDKINYLESMTTRKGVRSGYNTRYKR